MPPKKNGSPPFVVMPLLALNSSPPLRASRRYVFNHVLHYSSLQGDNVYVLEVAGFSATESCFHHLKGCACPPATFTETPSLSNEVLWPKSPATGEIF